MAKYGSFTWGDGTLYGSTATPNAQHTWVVNVDWDGDGSYDGTNEGIYLVGCNIKRGREDYLNTSGNGFEHMRVGTATLTFDNSTGRFDPRNTAGALYGNLKPGRKIQIGAYSNSDEYNYVLFTGLIDDIIPTGYRQTTVVKCVDYMQWLVDQQLTFDAELFNTTISGALEHLLTQAQYPGGRNISTALTVDNQPIWVFAVNGESAATVAHQVADAGLGIFYIDRYGNACYQPRNHLTNANNMTEASFLNDPQVSQPWDGVYNHVTVTRLRYVKQQASIIFNLSEAVYIANGNSETIEISYDPSTDVQIKEIVANTRYDGEGTALTFTASAVDLGYTGGTVTVHNGSGSNGYLTDIVIRGRKYLDTQQKYTASDTASQAEYGIRRFQLNSPFLQDGNYASTFATILKNFLKDDRESLVLKLRGNPTYLQYDKDLCTRVKFTSATLGITDQVYDVLGIDHDWLNENGQDVITTWYLHKVLVDNTSITSSSLETAPRVPPAPDGYDDPGGDPDTIPSEVPSESPLSGLDHIFYNSKAVMLSSDVDSSGNVNWFAPSNYSSDISASTIYSASTPTRHNITQPGWYEVNLYGYLAHGSNTTATDEFIASVNLYSASGTLLNQLAVTNFSKSMIVGECLPFYGSYVFNRSQVGGDVGFFTIGLTSLSPSPFFVYTRYIYLYLICKRIRRQT